MPPLYALHELAGVNVSQDGDGLSIKSLSQEVRRDDSEALAAAKREIKRLKEAIKSLEVFFLTG